MADAMVTGRMDAQKKAEGMRILRREGLSASQAVNLLFDRVVAEGSCSFLYADATDARAAHAAAAPFVDALVVSQASRFDDMSKAQIRSERLRAKGLM